MPFQKELVRSEMLTALSSRVFDMISYDDNRNSEREV